MPPQQKDAPLEYEIPGRAETLLCKRGHSSLRLVSEEREEEKQTFSESADCDDSDELRDFLEGCSVPGDSGTDPKIKPAWVNDELLRKGQRIGMEYIFSQFVSNLIALQFLLAYPNASEPLIATGKSDTPESAKRRYLSTCRRIIRWYSGDLWGDSSAATEMSVVRAMHSRIRKSLQNATQDRLVKAFALEPTEVDPERPLWRHVQDMYAGEKKKIAIPPNYENNYNRPFLSQSEMITTQFSFFGFMLSSPPMLGMRQLSDDDLEALVHLWAAIGYQLGIEDRYNKCIGGLESARKTWKLCLDRVFVPALAVASPRWEHMNRCITKGLRSVLYVSPSLEVSVLYLTELTGKTQAAEKARALLSWQDRAFTRLYNFVFQFLMDYAPIRYLTSILLTRKINNLCKFYSKKPDNMTREHKFQ